jgi:hypothetical protein
LITIGVMAAVALILMLILFILGKKKGDLFIIKNSFF